MTVNWFEDMFINEAKKAVDSRQTWKSCDDKIDRFEESLIKYVRINTLYEVGGITIRGTNAGLNDDTTNTRARSACFLSINSIEKILCSDGSYSLRYYDKSGTYLGSGKYNTWLTYPEYDVSDGAPENAYYVRVVVRYNDDSTITDTTPFYDMVKVLTTVNKLDEIDNALFKHEIKEEQWELGNIRVGDGYDIEDGTRVRTKTFFALNCVKKIVCSNGSYSLRFYDEDKQFVGRGLLSGWLTYSEYDVSSCAPENAYYVRVVAKYIDDSTISDVTPFYDMVKVLTSVNRLDEIEASLEQLSNIVSEYLKKN